MGCDELQSRASNLIFPNSINFSSYLCFNFSYSTIL